MREITYLSLHCHHQNDFCIKMGNEESHFNVSLTVRDKVTRQCPQTKTFGLSIWSKGGHGLHVADVIRCHISRVKTQ